MTPGGMLGVFRSRNRGASWEQVTNGLPQANSIAHVYRAAACADSLDPAGIYLGTQGGHLMASRNGGDGWETIFNWLPPIYSVQAAIIDK